MFDLGWTEMFVIVVVAIIVIGPKDLPRALRTVGQWVGKARSMGREFQRGIDEMIREAELDDMKKQVEKAGRLDLKKEAENTIDPTGTIRETMKPISVEEKEKPAVVAPAEKPAETGGSGDSDARSAEETRSGSGESGAEPDTKSQPPDARTGT